MDPLNTTMFIDMYISKNNLHLNTSQAIIFWQEWSAYAANLVLVWNSRYKIILTLMFLVGTDNFDILTRKFKIY